MTLEESVRLVDAVLQGYISIDDIKPSHNDHEEQLKLASDVYSTDKMHMYQELKAKDKQITELNHTVSGLNEMYLEAKEEIERLKTELNSAFIRDLKSIKMSSNGKHATWKMLKEWK